jgi:hypothetical protein
MGPSLTLVETRIIPKLASPAWRLALGQFNLGRAMRAWIARVQSQLLFRLLRPLALLTCFLSLLTW